MSVTLEGTEVFGEQVEVLVEITRYSDSVLFDREVFPNSSRFILEREGEIWRFTEPPWPMGWCPGLERGSTLPGPTRVEPY